MAKSSPRYEPCWCLIKSFVKPCVLHMIRSRDQPSSYSGDLLNLLFIIIFCNISIPYPMYCTCIHTQVITYSYGHF